MADFRDTLMLPFSSGALEGPKPGENWCILNADVLPMPDGMEPGDFVAEQGFRSDFLALEAAGYVVQPRLDAMSELNGCLVLAHRSRAVNERNILRAWNALKPGGVLVFAGTKTSGVQPMRKWVGRGAQVDGSLSKHHAVAFWVHRNGDPWQADRLQKPDSDFEWGKFRVTPGMFSADGTDVGSALLAEHFSDRIFGRVADFGAGWGYLSSCLIERCSRIEQLELFEADWTSLEAARSNVVAAGDMSVDYHWCDMTREAPRTPFNWVVMNPPFHTSRAAEPALGNRFIEAAARCLPAGGRLLMVANTNLPYERTLQNLFKKVERLDQANGFKVLEAVKGSR